MTTESQVRRCRSCSPQIQEQLTGLERLITHRFDTADRRFDKLEEDHETRIRALEVDNTRIKTTWAALTVVCSAGVTAVFEWLKGGKA